MWQRSGHACSHSERGLEQGCVHNGGGVPQRYGAGREAAPQTQVKGSLTRRPHGAQASACPHCASQLCKPQERICPQDSRHAWPALRHAIRFRCCPRPLRLGLKSCSVSKMPSPTSAFCFRNSQQICPHWCFLHVRLSGHTESHRKSSRNFSGSSPHSIEIADAPQRHSARTF